jgi:hypothetical protein
LAPLQAELKWCLESGRVLTRCGIWSALVQHRADGSVEFSLRWNPRGSPGRIITALRVLPATWNRYEPMFVAHLAAELLSREVERAYEA